MVKSDRTAIIFADVQQEVPEYLCIDEAGILYLCTVGQQGGRFVEQVIKKMSCVEAHIFIANTSIKARKIISESESPEKHKG
ncbi:hypothetical protein LJC58_01630 [Lachnospiraceae bacterium OttesenSCG-928-D06]|nr:hypothetical protein [Lachnospiraceae bacterium OttesenSCG-928-D06]